MNAERENRLVDRTGVALKTISKSRLTMDGLAI